MASEQTKIAVMQSDLGYIKKSVDSMGVTLKDLDGKFATKEELIALKLMVETTANNSVTKESFWPVKIIVYSGAGIVLTAVLYTILTGLGLKPK